MAADPDSYVGYVDGGENRFATEEELKQLNQFGPAADPAVQAMLLGQTTPEECAEALASFYSWSQDSEWVKERFAQ